VPRIALAALVSVCLTGAAWASLANGAREGHRPPGIRRTHFGITCFLGYACDQPLRGRGLPARRWSRIRGIGHGHLRRSEGARWADRLLPFPAGQVAATRGSQNADASRSSWDASRNHVLLDDSARRRESLCALRRSRIQRLGRPAPRDRPKWTREARLPASAV